MKSALGVSKIFVEQLLIEIRRGWGVDLKKDLSVKISKADMSKLAKSKRIKKKKKRIKKK